MDNILSDEIIACYEEAKNEVIKKLNELLESFIALNPDYGFYIRGRIKDLKRIEDKLKRKYKDIDSFDAKLVFENVTDIAGVRVIFAPIATSYNMNLFDITLRSLPIDAFEGLMAEAARDKKNNNIDIIYDFINKLARNGFNIIPSKTKDYISKPKESGYMSYHVTVIASNGFPVEIQMRNFLQHVYAEAEHKRYEGDPKDEKVNSILEQWNSLYDKVYNDINTNIKNFKYPIEEFSTMATIYYSFNY